MNNIPVDDILKYLSYFSQKIRFDIPYKLCPKEKQEKSKPRRQNYFEGCKTILKELTLLIVYPFPFRVIFFLFFFFFDFQIVFFYITGDMFWRFLWKPLKAVICGKREPVMDTIFNLGIQTDRHELII